MKKRTLALLVALVLVVGCIIGGTLAWLTAKTDAVVNTFTTSDIDVTLTETEEEYKMVPGYTIHKDPKTTVVKGSEECYLFVKVEKSANFDSYMTYEMADGWTALEGVENKDNSDYYDLRHNGGRNGNLYHKLDDGSYVTVSVERHRPYTYTECPTTWTNDDGKRTEPMFEFERPDVDVEIKDITVTAKDKNVYLLGDLTADQIKSGATAKVGDVELKLGKENYGLESWQYEYVNIEVSYQDKDGNTVTDLSDLKEDTTYSVSVKVTPKNSGTVSEQSGKGDGTINVFKPELTYKDSEVYYGDTVPADFTANKVSESWKHGDTTSSDEGVVMTGDAPVLAMTYTPDDTKIQDGKVNTKQDVPVKAEVKIGTEDVQQYTTFVHQDCSPACGWNETTLDGDPAFLLHVKTCQLTINKQGGAGDEPYVFDVYKDDKKYTEVTIVGNNSEIIYELPVGTYTIQEDEGWSWRYSGNNGSGATLTAEKPDGWITCTNSKDNNYWLNGFSEVVKNIFGGKN